MDGWEHDENTFPFFVLQSNYWLGLYRCKVGEGGHPGHHVCCVNLNHATSDALHERCTPLHCTDSIGT